MLSLLEEIRRQTPDANPILGDREIRVGVPRLEALPPDAPAAQRAWMLREVGIGYHKDGQQRKAIEYLTKAIEVASAKDSGVRFDQINDVRFRLGIACIRLGTNENCAVRPFPGSCILPFHGETLYRQEDGPRMAAAAFLDLLKHETPKTQRYLGGIWLLNIAYMTLGQYPDAVPEPYRLARSPIEGDAPFPHFPNIAQKRGIDAMNLSGGAIADDFDNDGRLDLVTSTWDTGGQMHYYRNKGDGAFIKHTKEANLTGLYGGLNMIHADYNNDGHLDLLVLRGGWLPGSFGQMPNSLLRNNGDGTFTDVTFDVGLGFPYYPTQTAFADYDNDGDLDLYIGNEAGPRAPFPCQLFRNNGDGTFTDVAAAAGVTNSRFTKGVTWGDYDGDRDPDLYVSNLMGPNRLYRNNGDGTFTDVAPASGVTGPFESFPVWFWDYNNDGALDLFVPTYGNHIWDVAAYFREKPLDTEPAGHFEGDGKGGFVNRVREQGLVYPMLPMGCNFGDLDNDGYLDFYLGTGYPDYASIMPNVMFHSVAGERFENVTVAGGFGHLQKGHGVTFADFDGDGDQDVFEQMGGWFRGDPAFNTLYENPGFGNHWIAVLLEGVTSNRSAIGARIRVDIEEDGQARSIYRHVNAGGSFGGNPLRQTIGVGKATVIQRLEIYWPTSDTTQVFENVAVDRVIRIVESQSQIGHSS